MTSWNHHRAAYRPAILLFALVTMGPWVGSARADGNRYVLHANGQATTLIRSANEYFVIMDAPQELRTWAKMAADPDLVFRPVPWAEDIPECGLVTCGKSDAAAKIAAVTGVASVRPVYRLDPTSPPMFSTGRLILRVRTDLTRAQREQLFDEYKVAMVEEIDAPRGVFAVRPTRDAMDGDVRTAEAMSSDDRMVFAEPDFIVETELRQVLEQVNDEFFEQEWHLRNTGQGLGTVGADINVEEAWEITFGEDVRVGIFDDSVDVEHEDLVGNYLNFGHDPQRSEQSPLAPLPRNITDSHGTSVIGLAVGDANDVGIRGVAPAARFTASRGINDLLSLGQMASAFTFARQQDVDVHNNSWGFPGLPNSQVQVVVDSIRSSYENGREGKGMVVVFAAGNSAEELGADDDLATLPEVIGVGASNAEDRLASYSNYGATIDVVAPAGDSFLPMLVTTDNSDDAGFASFGYNDGSGTDIFGQSDLPDGQYTRNFSGTSGACPIVTGVAALALSQNLQLTADQIRVVLTQTADKINPLEASYHPITERSLRYGYGRVNAGAAVLAARASVDNGGFTWPESVQNVRLVGTSINWQVGDKIRQIDDDEDPDTPSVSIGERTSATLVIESNSAFSATNAFLPEDGIVYSVGQAVGSGMVVVQESNGTNFRLPGTSPKRYYALFSRNAIGRYGFGVTIDTDGLVVGDPLAGGTGGGDGGGSTPVQSKPRVSIEVTPLSGQSPLEVRFRGNALSEVPIDTMTWDFDDGETANRSTVTHRYVFSGTGAQRFFPSFTVVDEAGNEGVRSVAIDVFGDAAGSDGSQAGDIRVVISLPGSVGSDVDHGLSPFPVELNIAGAPAEGTVTNIIWDLGDGTTARTQSVPHTYFNNSAGAQTLPISVTVETRTPSGTLVSQSATRFMTIDPDCNANGVSDVTDLGVGTSADANINGIPDECEAGDTGNPVENGGDGGAPGTMDACGAGSTMALIALLTLGLVRRRLLACH